MANVKPYNIAIFERLIRDGRSTLPPSLARYLLSLAFGNDDKERMRELARMNQDGLLTADGREELAAYVQAACWLGILQSQARKSLKNAKRK